MKAARILMVLFFAFCSACSGIKTRKEAEAEAKQRGETADLYSIPENQSVDEDDDQPVNPNPAADPTVSEELNHMQIDPGTTVAPIPIAPGPVKTKASAKPAAPSKPAVSAKAAAAAKKNAALKKAADAKKKKQKAAPKKDPDAE